jgi:Flp pilus assembly protein TadD
MVINSKLTFSNMVATNLFNQGNIEEAINLLQKALSIIPIILKR